MILNRKKLLDKMNFLGVAYSKKNIGSLENFKFDNGTLTMSDGQTIITTKIDYENSKDETEFKALIPYDLFKKILSKLNTENIEFIKEETELKIKSGKTRYKLNLVNFDSYPNFSIKEKENKIIMRLKDLREMVKKTYFACSQENTNKPILEGINFTNENNEITGIATNSFRLAKNKLKSNLKENFTFTISGNFLNSLMSVLPKEDLELKITYDENTLIFEYEDNIIQTVLLSGQYPDVSRVIPIISNYININRLDLIDALEKASVFVDEDLKQFMVQLNITQNEFEILSIHNQLGQVREVITCENEGENNSIYCNGNYLLEALKNCEENEIRMGIIGESKPFIITEKSNENMIHLILPMRKK